MATRRIDRDLARGRRAAAQVRMRGGSAWAAANAYVGSTFSSAVQHAALKDRVAALMRRGATHPDVRRRYRALLERHQVTNIDAAVTEVERIRRAEREARTLSIKTWGHCNRSRLTLMLVEEIRLILRMLRRYAPGRFSDVTAEVRATQPVWASARSDQVARSRLKLMEGALARRPRRAMSRFTERRSQRASRLSRPSPHSPPHAGVSGEGRGVGKKRSSGNVPEGSS